MNVKSVFLNVVLNEEAYLEQPKGFEDPHLPNHVFKLKKTLYGLKHRLKQAPRAWYERLTKFLVEKGYKRGGVEKTLFVKQFESSIIIAQIYVDDIVFCSTFDSKVHNFVSLMKWEFEISMVGELIYFIGS